MAIPETSTKERLELRREIINFMGPEGSGKTTIARRLSEASGKPYITIGDILRDMAENDKTEYGDECRATLKEHRYLNPYMLSDILVQRFSRDDLEDGFILDGGLRSTKQVQEFRSVLERAGRTMPVITLHLRVPGWMGIQRLTKDETVRRREDDHVEAVLSRLSSYYDHLGQRASLIEKQEGWRLIHIDATGTPDETFSKVTQAFR